MLIQTNLDLINKKSLVNRCPRGTG